MVCAMSSGDGWGWVVCVRVDVGKLGVDEAVNSPLYPRKQALRTASV